MDPLPIFPDVEAAILARLLQVDGTQGGTYLPADFKLRIAGGFWRVYRSGGTRNWLEDIPTIGVDLFAPTRTIGRIVAEQGDQLIAATPWHVTVNGDVVGIDSVIYSTGPREVPWGDDGVRRWVADYRPVLRR